MSSEIEKLLLKPSEAFKAMSIGRSTGYALIASGELPSVRIGRAVRVPVDGLREWVKRQTEKNDSTVGDSEPLS